MLLSWGKDVRPSPKDRQLTRSDEGRGKLLFFGKGTLFARTSSKRSVGQGGGFDRNFPLRNRQWKGGTFANQGKGSPPPSRPLTEEETCRGGLASGESPFRLRQGRSLLKKGVQGAGGRPFTQDLFKENWQKHSPKILILVFSLTGEKKETNGRNKGFSVRKGSSANLILENTPSNGKKGRDPRKRVYNGHSPSQREKTLTLRRGKAGKEVLSWRNKWRSPVLLAVGLHLWRRGREESSIIHE